jgi:hypothetical protein
MPRKIFVFIVLIGSDTQRLLFQETTCYVPRLYAISQYVKPTFCHVCHEGSNDSTLQRYIFFPERKNYYVIFLLIAHIVIKVTYWLLVHMTIWRD